MFVRRRDTNYISDKCDIQIVLRERKSETDMIKKKGVLDKTRVAVRDHGSKYTIRRAFESFVSQVPPTKFVYWRLAPVYYRRRLSKNFNEYRAPIDPCARLHVDPDSIKLMTGRTIHSHVGRYQVFATIRNGDWDIENTREFQNNIIYRSIRDRFVSGIDWSETEIYTEALKEIEHNNVIWNGCETESDIDDRCAEMDRLYKDIKEHGYRSQYSLRDTKRNTGYINELLNEILVDIDRNGNILFVDGRHRLSIAKILDLETIPVVCVVRHKKWMELRDEYWFANNQTHPDIQHHSV